MGDYDNNSDSSFEDALTDLNEDQNEKKKEERKYGCAHYACRCAYISPCCGKEYVCRICHDENETHEIDRFKVKEIVCLVCKKRQPVSRHCIDCEVLFGKYSCLICRLFDDTDKKQFHCDFCGLCRIGGRENFFHCPKCDHCLDISLKNSHKCIEKASRSCCPVCLENLHSSRTPLSVFPCGHFCHRSCFKGLLNTGNYSCPLCGECMVDMSEVWTSLDREIQVTPMPEDYKDTKFWILCKDCHKKSLTPFHALGLKCQQCGSYNTCRSSEDISALRSENATNSSSEVNPSTSEWIPNSSSGGTSASTSTSGVTSSTTSTSEVTPTSSGSIFSEERNLNQIPNNSTLELTNNIEKSKENSQGQIKRRNNSSGDES